VSSSSERIQLTLSRRESILTADVSHIHEDLGTVRQLFVREMDAAPYPESLNIYISYFVVLPKGSSQPQNFSQVLSRQEKDALWSEIFSLKNRFLAEGFADVIVHDVKLPFSPERRLELYRAHLNLQGYVLFGSGRSIYLEREGM
jgi:hypothetical protein